MGPDMGPRGVVPEEEWLAGLRGTVDEIDGPADQFFVDALHVEFGFWIHVRVRGQPAAVGDRLLADLAPARIAGGIVRGRRLAGDDVARVEHGVEFSVLPV